MSEHYELRLRERSITDATVLKHTSYDLIIHKENGDIEIQSIDLYQNKDGKIAFNMGTSQGNEYTLSNGKKLIWESKTLYDQKK